jgi:23S rRNA (cytidine1920-2'-O)/16S rRNA (cytidine1409-2'-O)-methyltransferase
LLEETDARHLTAAMIGEAPSLIVCDASFIGLEKVLAGIAKLAALEAWLVGLFKPQFEVGPRHVGKGGIVTDESAADRAAMAVEAWLSSQGWKLTGWTPSPITGGDGNSERLFCCRNY